MELNQFIDDNIAIILTDDSITVQFNNKSNYDFDLNYNYFDTINANNISNKINDRCDNNWSYDGLIKFYPYFISKLIADNNNSSQLPTRSISQYEYEQNCVIEYAPTQSPTMKPTKVPVNTETINDTIDFIDAVNNCSPFLLFCFIYTLIILF